MDADVNDQGSGVEVDQNWLVDVCLDLAAGVQVDVSRSVGDVPTVVARVGQVRLLVGMAVGDVTDLDERHVAAATEFAVAARALADEVCELVVGRHGDVPQALGC